jgi:hypothetical protein
MRRPGEKSVPATPLLKTLSLQTSDHPAGFQLNIGHVFTNAELVRERQTPVSTAVGEGRLLSYETSYDSDASQRTFYVRGVVAAYSGADRARTEYSTSLQTQLQSFQSDSNTQHLHESTVSGPGDGASVVSFHYTVRSVGYRAYFLSFHRGSYAASVSAGFATSALTPDQELAQVVAMARVVDARILASH